MSSQKQNQQVRQAWKESQRGAPPGGGSARGRPTPGTAKSSVSFAGGSSGGGSMHVQEVGGSHHTPGGARGGTVSKTVTGGRKGRRRRFMETKESGWSTSTPLSEKGIPSYDSALDSTCPFTHTERFASQHKSQRKAEAAEDSRKRQRSGVLSKSLDGGAGGNGGGRGQYNDDSGYSGGGTPGPLAQTAPPGGYGGGMGDAPPGSGGTSMLDEGGSYRGPNGQHHSGVSNASTMQGGVTFSAMQSTDPAQELDVLKNILLREGYVERIRVLTKDGRSKQMQLRNELIDLLDLVRVQTVETVEAVGRWRRTLAKPHPFVWNGVNYLLKIPSDLDFLDVYNPLVAWLGFPMVRNPFVIPVVLDDRPDTPARQQHLGAGVSVPDGMDGRNPANASSVYGSTNDSAFTSIGGLEDSSHVFSETRPWGPLDPDASLQSSVDGGAAGGAGGAAGLNETGDSLLAYTTPVINDMDMLPARQAPPRPPRAVERKAERPLPSHIGDLDMLRVRESEKLILQEEMLRGRMMRDEYGRLIPEAVRLAKDQDIIAMDRHNHPDGPDAAGPDPRKGGWKSESSAAAEEVLEDGAPKGHVRARKEGGRLVPLSRKGVDQKRKGPTKRARGARMDMDIKRGKQENDRLGQELEDLRNDLLREQLEVGRLEEAELDEHAATAIQGAVRGRKARLTVEQRKQSLALQSMEVEKREVELEQRRREISRKEDIRLEHKRRRLEEQRARRQALLDRKRRERGGGDAGAGNDGRDDDGRPRYEMLSVEDQAAIMIQRIARGRQGKTSTQRKRVRFNGASVRVQSIIRGRTDRARVLQRRLEMKAAMLVQRLLRGLVSRMRVKRIRQELLEHSSANSVQRYLRGVQGRHRMHAKRALIRKAGEAKSIVDALFAADLIELADNDELPPVVLNLLQGVRILFPSGLAPPKPAGSSCYSWKRMRRRMRRPRFLPRLRKLADAAVDQVLQLPPARVKAVQVFFHDPDLTPITMLRLAKGSKAAHNLLIWLQRLVEANGLLKHFVNPEADSWYGFPSSKWMEKESGAEVDSDSSDDESIDKLESKRFVPREVLRAGIVRPRPIMVCVARDVPERASRLLVDNIMAAMPGAFARIDLDRLDVGILQNALDTGQSIIVFVDIGCGATTRRAFVAQMTQIKKVLEPTPICVLVRGDDTNRLGTGANPLFGCRSSLRRMGLDDAAMKGQLEKAAESVFPLTTEDGIEAIAEMSKIPKPDYGLVLVMESIIILLSPQQIFKGPSHTVGAVTWEIAVELLRNPKAFIAKLARVRYDSVPAENIHALQLYVRHPGWPSIATLSGKNTKGGGVPPLACLCGFVEAIVTYAGLLVEQGGPPPPIMRKGGIFASVTTVQDHSPEVYGGQYQGWRLAYANILGHLLRDVKVYSEARRIGGNSMVCHVYRDRQRIYFAAYDPGRSIQHHTMIEDTAVNRLLAPNSVEKSDKGKDSSRTPPTTSFEMYQRLVELLRIEHLPQQLAKAHEGDPDKPPPEWLTIRRPISRLLRVSRRVENVDCVVTASEASPGEIMLHVYVPAEAKTHALLVDDELVRRLAADAVGMGDQAEADELLSGYGDRMALPIVDRVQLRRTSTGRGPLRLLLRSKGGGGRIVISEGRSITGSFHVVKIFESLNRLRVDVYNPRRCEQTTFLLSPRERLELLGSLSWGRKDLWVKECLRRLSHKGPRNEQKQVALDRTVHRQGQRVGKTRTTATLNMGDGPAGGITISAYVPTASQTFAITLPDDVIRGLVVSMVGRVDTEEKYHALPASWPVKKQRDRVLVFGLLLSLLRWAPERSLEEVKMPGETLGMEPLLEVGLDGEAAVGSALPTSKRTVGKQFMDRDGVAATNTGESIKWDVPGKHMPAPKNDDGSKGTGWGLGRQQFKGIKSLAQQAAEEEEETKSAMREAQMAEVAAEQKAARQGGGTGGGLGGEEKTPVTVDGKAVTLVTTPAPILEEFEDVYSGEMQIGLRLLEVTVKEETVPWDSVDADEWSEHGYPKGRKRSAFVVHARNSGDDFSGRFAQDGVLDGGLIGCSVSVPALDVYPLLLAALTCDWVRRGLVIERSAEAADRVAKVRTRQQGIIAERALKGGADGAAAAAELREIVPPPEASKLQGDFLDMTRFDSFVKGRRIYRQGVRVLGTGGGDQRDEELTPGQLKAQHEARRRQRRGDRYTDILEEFELAGERDVYGQALVGRVIDVARQDGRKARGNIVEFDIVKSEHKVEYDGEGDDWHDLRKLRHRLPTARELRAEAKAEAAAASGVESKKGGGAEGKHGAGDEKDDDAADEEEEYKGGVFHLCTAWVMHKTEAAATSAKEWEKGAGPLGSRVGTPDVENDEPRVIRIELYNPYSSTSFSTTLDEAAQRETAGAEGTNLLGRGAEEMLVGHLVDTRLIKRARIDDNALPGMGTEGKGDLILERLTMPLDVVQRGINFRSAVRCPYRLDMQRTRFFEGDTKITPLGQVPESQAKGGDRRRSTEIDLRGGAQRGDVGGGKKLVSRGHRVRCVPDVVKRTELPPRYLMCSIFDRTDRNDPYTLPMSAAAAAPPGTGAPATEPRAPPSGMAVDSLPRLEVQAYDPDSGWKGKVMVEGDLALQAAQDAANHGSSGLAEDMLSSLPARRLELAGACIRLLRVLPAASQSGAGAELSQDRLVLENGDEAALEAMKEDENEAKLRTMHVKEYLDEEERERISFDGPLVLREAMLIAGEYVVVHVNAVRSMAGPDLGAGAAVEKDVQAEEGGDGGDGGDGSESKADGKEGKESTEGVEVTRDIVTALDSRPPAARITLYSPHLSDSTQVALGHALLAKVVDTLGGDARALRAVVEEANMPLDETDPMTMGPHIIGRPVLLFREDRNGWAMGAIAAYDTSSGQHKVVFTGRPGTAGSGFSGVSVDLASLNRPGSPADSSRPGSPGSLGSQGSRPGTALAEEWVHLGEVEHRLPRRQDEAGQLPEETITALRRLCGQIQLWREQEETPTGDVLTRLHSSVAMDSEGNWLDITAHAATELVAKQKRLLAIAQGKRPIAGQASMSASQSIVPTHEDGEHATDRPAEMFHKSMKIGDGRYVTVKGFWRTDDATKAMIVEGQKPLGGTEDTAMFLTSGQTPMVTSNPRKKMEGIGLRFEVYDMQMSHTAVLVVSHDDLSLLLGGSELTALLGPTPPPQTAAIAAGLVLADVDEKGREAWAARRGRLAETIAAQIVTKDADIFNHMTVLLPERADTKVRRGIADMPGIQDVLKTMREEERVAGVREAKAAEQGPPVASVYAASTGEQTNEEEAAAAEGTAASAAGPRTASAETTMSAGDGESMSGVSRPATTDAEEAESLLGEAVADEILTVGRRKMRVIVREESWPLSLSVSVPDDLGGRAALQVTAKQALGGVVRVLEARFSEAVLVTALNVPPGTATRDVLPRLLPQLTVVEGVLTLRPIEEDRGMSASRDRELMAMSSDGGLGNLGDTDFDEEGDDMLNSRVGGGGLQGATLSRPRSAGALSSPNKKKQFEVVDWREGEGGGAEGYSATETDMTETETDMYSANEDGEGGAGGYRPSSSEQTSRGGSAVAGGLGGEGGGGQASVRTFSFRCGKRYRGQLYLMWLRPVPDGGGAVHVSAQRVGGVNGGDKKLRTMQIETHRTKSTSLADMLEVLSRDDEAEDE